LLGRRTRFISLVEMVWQLVTAALVVGDHLIVEETLRLGDDAATVVSLLTAIFAVGPRSRRASAALSLRLPVHLTDVWAVIAMRTYLAEADPDAMRGRVYATWLGAVTLAAR
jgi:hypothetical protein